MKYEISFISFCSVFIYILVFLGSWILGRLLVQFNGKFEIPRDGDEELLRQYFSIWQDRSPMGSDDFRSANDR
ncbi:hypothetical protein [Undibacterium terreum]|uniref:Uncharacterized protein n=1 Tax=Undibacterium terreum TaxID=1224302 RepID=A0A916V0L6_9BURK|nr:hypothetical protein [Undibacterium terreum]GGC98098.1 hypothetical protein GCM10011396_52020 [Undibacterium terreum]